MNGDGLKINCVYCWPCKTDFREAKILVDFVLNAKSKVEIIRIIKGLKPYATLLTIARENNSDVFSEGVARHYWRGKPIEPNAFWDFRLCHNYETLFGSLAGKDFQNGNIVKAVVESLIMPGQIRKIEKDGFFVEYQPVTLESKRLVFGEKTGKRIINPFRLVAAVNDRISFHLSSAAERLTLDDAVFLRMVTERAVREFNAEFLGK